MMRIMIMTMFALAIGTSSMAFAGTGKQVTDLSSGMDHAYAVAQHPWDNKLIVAGFAGNAKSQGDFGLVRYLTDGTPDKSFGSNGIVTTDFNGSQDIADAIAIDEKTGMFIVAGSAQDGGKVHAALARYTFAGALDPSFGVNGKVQNQSLQNFSALAIDNSFGIIAAGEAAADFAIARYDWNGQLDPSFGVGGTVIFHNIGGANTPFDYATSVALQSDGKIVVVGNTQNAYASDMVFVRLNPNGTLDPTFGNGLNGIAIIDCGGSDVVNGLKIQSDGKIVAIGHSTLSGQTMAFVRLGTNGVLDPSFGNGGISLPHIGAMSGPKSQQQWGRSLDLQSNGKIVAAGFNLEGTSFYEFIIMRLNSDGSLDTSFGGGKIIGGGAALIPFDNSPDAKAFGVTVQSDDKIVAAGFVFNNTTLKESFGVVRLDAQGVLDTSFR